MNPFHQARAPVVMVRRKPGQGLDFGLTAKGSHKETGRSMSQFMAAICSRTVLHADTFFLFCL